MLEREVQDQEYQISAKNSETHSLQVSVNHRPFRPPVNICVSD